MSLKLSFHICQMGVKIATTSSGSCKNSMNVIFKTVLGVGQALNKITIFTDTLVIFLVKISPMQHKPPATQEAFSDRPSRRRRPWPAAPTLAALLWVCRGLHPRLYVLLGGPYFFLQNETPQLTGSILP